MAYRYGNREQMKLFPESIEDYVSKDDPVRVYDAFVASVNLEEVGIKYDDNQVGNSEYDPRAMLKLIIYGYSYGHRSSRKLERAVYHNISFIWLMGGLKPDHKTIARFRIDNREGIKEILRQSARLCIKLGLIEGNTLFVDGSPIRANVSIKNSWDAEKCERHLKKIDKRIDFILKECDRIDNQEENTPSLVKLNEELKGQGVLRKKIQEIMQELKQEQKKSVNTTDSDCVKIKGRQGTHASYNSQIVVDDKHGLIVHSDVVHNNNDLNQFAGQINQANATLERKCKTACADAGYAHTDELKKIDDQDIKVIVPSQKQVYEREPKEFDKEKFEYDSGSDCYVCPQGQKLIYKGINKETNSKSYQIADKSICVSCKHFGVCTSSPTGRRINRLVNEEVKIKLERQYKEESAQAIYKLRKQKVELPFGHIKRNLGVTSFLLRGLDGVKAEMSVLATCFNIARMITIWGVPTLITKLTG